MRLKKLFFPERDAWFCSEYSPEKLLEVMQKNTRSGGRRRSGTGEKDYFGEIYPGGFWVERKREMRQAWPVMRGFVQPKGSGSYLRVHLNVDRKLIVLSGVICAYAILLQLILLVIGIINQEFRTEYFSPTVVAVIAMLMFRIIFYFSCRVALSDLAFVLKLEPIKRKEK